MRFLLVLVVLLFGLTACAEDEAAVSPAPATTQLETTPPPAPAEPTEPTPPNTPAPSQPVVISLKTDDFGEVLARPDRQALYYWAVEKRAGGQIKCLGACAEAWPPLYAKSRAAVSARLAGVPGRFGVIERPDGRLQVTHDGLPVYTYAHEPPGVVLCDDVDDWFVVRLG